MLRDDIHNQQITTQSFQHRPNIMVSWLALLLHVQKSSVFNSEPDYSDVFHGFPQSCQTPLSTLGTITDEYYVLWSDDWQGKTKLLRNVSQCHLFYNTFHMNCPGIESRTSWREANLSYGMASKHD
jgi:hypothetical protein